MEESFAKEVGHFNVARIIDFTGNFEFSISDVFINGGDGHDRIIEHAHIDQ